MKVLLVGEGTAATQTFRRIVEAGYDVVAVMTSPSAQSDHTSTLWSVAAQLGYRTWPAEQVRDPRLADRIRSEKVDILLNIYSLFIIHSQVLGSARIGCFNVHPGPLPRYAGLNSMCWAIYRGETAHSVTVHAMEPTVDAGPIAYRSIFPIEEEDSGLQLAGKCIRVGVELALRPRGGRQ